MNEEPPRLLLDEHYAESIAQWLRKRGHDVVAIVADPDDHGMTDRDVYTRAVEQNRRIVTEDVKDFRPMLTHASTLGSSLAQLLLVSSRRYPRGGQARNHAIAEALEGWLTAPGVASRPDEDWLA